MLFEVAVLDKNPEVLAEHNDWAEKCDRIEDNQVDDNHNYEGENNFIANKIIEDAKFPDSDDRKVLILYPDVDGDMGAPRKFNYDVVATNCDRDSDEFKRFDESFDNHVLRFARDDIPSIDLMKYRMVILYRVYDILDIFPIHDWCYMRSTPLVMIIGSDVMNLEVIESAWTHEHTYNELSVRSNPLNSILRRRGIKNTYPYVDHTAPIKLDGLDRIYDSSMIVAAARTFNFTSVSSYLAAVVKDVDREVNYNVEKDLMIGFMKSNPTTRLFSHHLNKTLARMDINERIKPGYIVDGCILNTRGDVIRQIDMPSISRGVLIPFKCWYMRIGSCVEIVDVDIDGLGRDRYALMTMLGCRISQFVAGLKWMGSGFNTWYYESESQEQDKKASIIYRAYYNSRMIDGYRLTDHDVDVLKEVFLQYERYTHTSKSLGGATTLAERIETIIREIDIYCQTGGNLNDLRIKPILCMFFVSMVNNFGVEDDLLSHWVYDCVDFERGVNPGRFNEFWGIMI